MPGCSHGKPSRQSNGGGGSPLPRQTNRVHNSFERSNWVSKQVGLPSASETIGLVTALAPGLVIVGVRQWFVAAPPPKLEERIVAWAGVSIVYLAAANPIASAVKLPADMAWITAALEYVGVPAIIGGIAGVAARKDWGDRFWRLFGTVPVHHAPTAWDYAFSRLKRPPFVLVTLADGSTVGGLYDEGSFAASSSGERDLLISDVWQISEVGAWTRMNPARGVLLCGRDIRSVEFLREANDEQQAEPAKGE